MFNMKTFNLTTLIVASMVLLMGAAVAAPAPMPLTTPPPQTDATFINTVLAKANAYRKQHSAAPLTWDPTLASFALSYANKCNGLHSGGKYGENVYMFWTTDPNPSFTSYTNAAIDWWASEASHYKPNNPYDAYHFTQLVWKSSKRIGCAWTNHKCADAHGSYYLYCEFDPMGNIAGQFTANVS